MIVESIAFSNFRNIAQTSFEPGPGVNVLTGANGQGKTNVLEGIWLLCGQRSFRQAKDIETVREGEKRGLITAGIRSRSGAQTIKITLGARRSAEVNGLKMDRPSALGERFAATVFYPRHIELLRDGPEIRRAFIDSAILSTKPAFSALLRSFEKALYHRNYLLKSLQENSDRETVDVLAAYTEKTAQLGARLYAARSRYTARLCETAPAMYRELSGGESLELIYRPSVECEPEDYGKTLYRKLCETVNEDIRNGYTGYGPHREDVEILIEGKKARLFASQGQCKSAALCLKLSEGAILEKAIGEKPVFLLDDVMSELDRKRRRYITDRLGGNQLFITCCDAASIRCGGGKTVFTVKGGEVSRRKERKAACT